MCDRALRELNEYFKYELILRIAGISQGALVLERAVWGGGERAVCLV